MTIAISAQMRPIVSDFSAGGGSVIVDYLDLYPVTDTYPAEGTFTSRVFDAGNASATWLTLTAAVDAPEGTGVSFEVRTGTTPTPDATWTDWQPVGAGGALPGPAGRRYLQYRATLTTTDTSITPFVESVTLGNDVDTTAPAATIGGVTVTGTTATVTFSSTATDLARFECSLDSGTFQTCTSPRELTGLSDGSHTVRVRAVDQAGNIGTAAESTFVIDATAPAATIGGVTVTGTTATVTFSSTATDVARFECSLDGGAFQTCTSPRELTGLSDGSHTVRVRAIDQAGNVGRDGGEHVRHRRHGSGRDDRGRDRDRHDRAGDVLRAKPAPGSSAASTTGRSRRAPARASTRASRPARTPSGCARSIRPATWARPRRGALRSRRRSRPTRPLPRCGPSPGPCLSPTRAGSRSDCAARALRPVAGSCSGFATAARRLRARP